MRFLPVAEVLRDGVWTEIGPHAVVGQVGQTPTLLAVVDEHGDQVRVVYESWDARVLRWVPTAELHPTVLSPVALAGSAESRPREDHAAVLLLPGIPITVLEQADGRSRIETSDGEMRARGWIDDGLVGTIWVAEPFPDDPDATHTLAYGTPVLLSPASEAPVVATSADNAKAVVLGQTGGWSEIRVVGSWMNVHGYVEDWRLQDHSGDLYGGLVGSVAAPAEWPDVPAGTCLVAEPGGEVIGVTLASKDDQEPVPGGAKVPVATPWDTMTLIAEQTADGGWRSCPLAPTP